MDSGAAVFFGCIFLFIAFVYGLIQLSDYSCHSKWDDSKRPVKWELISGCRINDGKGWIPAANYRSF